MAFGPLIEQFIQALTKLPGVGPKSAQRMAFFLLERDRKSGLLLADKMQQAMQQVKQCDLCRTLTERQRCSICSNQHRNHHLLCVVESPADILAIEQSGSYRGLYFVLTGHLSPIDGIGPEQLGIPQLIERVKSNPFEEVVIATNLTVEGEATAYYLAEQLKDYPVIVSRIAHGVPFGGELEYVDGGTLAHALAGRKVF